MILYHHQSKSRRNSNQFRTFSRGMRSNRKLLWLAITLLVTIGVVRYFYDKSQPYTMEREAKFIVGLNSKKITYDRDMPLIFIGGVPRSGTTLMRAMLDAHPEVRCGQETRVVPRILQFFANWLKSEKETERLEEAGVSKDVLEDAVSQFTLEVIAKHGYAAPRLCNKDPLTLKYGMILKEMFPNIKFLFMIRDGRASVHSMISRKVTVSNFDLTNYRQCLQKWNQMIKSMFVQCELLGERCMMVHYEKLVLFPEEMVKKITKFLDLPWSDNMLHHEDFVNKTDGIKLSKVERSTDQVVKAINLEALSKWVGQIPEDVVKDMKDIAPMLGILGYDANANPPDYEKSEFKIDYIKLQNYEFNDKNSPNED